MSSNLFLLLSAPKGIKNPFLYYPECYTQDRNESVVAENGKYDLTRFSAHEVKTIREVLSVSQSKYPERYRALGLANESYVIVYKPRYILFEILVSLYKNSENPLDMIAVSFAYSQKGAMFRKEAIEFFEKSNKFVGFKTLDKFSSLSSASFYLKVAELYEQENENELAIYWLKKSLLRGGLNAEYLKSKIESIENKPPRMKRKRSPSESSIEFEKKVHLAASYFIRKDNLKGNEGVRNGSQKNSKC